MSQFAGKVAMITGSGSGIGRATALAFAQEKTRVVVSDISIEGGRETTRLIQEAGGEAIFVKCDVAHAEEIETLINTAVATYGSLDYAVNNAGMVGMISALAEYPLEVWNKVIAVNLTAAWLCMKHEVAQMLKQGGGAIVNMASVSGMVGFPTMSAYVASKHGLVGLTKSAAVEVAARGIRVNAVCPSGIETPMLLNSPLVTDPEQYKQIMAHYPIERLGKAEEVAAATVWLCSDAASFITGAVIPVDGAYTTQ